LPILYGAVMEEFSGEAYLSHLRRLGVVAIGTQRLRAGLMSSAPLALKRTAAATSEQSLGQSLELEGFEGDVLGGDEDFAGEWGFGGAAAEGFFGGDAH
jgi:hypothetical protein